MDAATAIGPSGGTATWTASYDAAGNTSCRAATTATTCAGTTPTGALLAYDDEGRLSAWQNIEHVTTSPAAIPALEEALYDGAGQRVVQLDESNATTTTTQHTYVGGTEDLASQWPNAGGAPTATMTAYYGGGLAESVNGTLSYTLSDPVLRSVSESVTTSGVVTATQLYGPYGSVRYASGTLPTDYAFTGQRADATSGLDDYGARYYDPVAGQFTSVDTTLAGGLKRYAYVGDNPETRTDPSGHIYANPRDYSRSLAMQQANAQPHVYFSSPQQFVADTAQFLFGTDTLRQSYYTIFLDKHASTGDKVKAAAVGLLTLGIDAETITTTLVGEPEIGGASRAAEETLLAANAERGAVTASAEMGDSYLDFAHGTSLEHAQNIMNGGLNADAARAATTGGLYSKPGSFFTFNATEYGNDAVQNAYEQGFTQSDKPVILMGRLPQSVFDELTAGGGVYVGRIPGIDIPETVFGPDTFDQLNRSMEWYEDLIDPYKNSR